MAASAPKETAARPSVSLVIPVYNEVDSVAPLIEEIVAAGLAAPPDFEVVFVDDGSTDGTTEALAALAARHEFARVFRLNRNSGKSAAWHLGFRMARGEWIVTLDADLQNDPADIPAMLDALAAGADLVSGQRRARADTSGRRIQSRIANYVRRAVLNDGALDVGCGMKAFRRECVRWIPYFNGWHRFFEALFTIYGFRVVSLPVNDRRRRFGRPKYGLMNRVGRATLDMLGVWWLKTRVVRYSWKRVAPRKP